MSSRTPLFPLLLCLASLLAGCGGDRDPAAVEADASTAEASAGAELPDPCTLLAADLVTRTFGVPEDQLTVEGGRGATHPLCTASWPKPDAEEIEAQMQELLAEHVERRRQAQIEGREFDEPLPDLSSRNSVYLTLGERHEDPAEAVARLESLVELMEEGMSVGSHEEESTFRTEFEDYRHDVGDEAAWNPGMSQLSVAAGGVLFHVRVDVSDEPSENREHAVELARAVVEKLG